MSIGASSSSCQKIPDFLVDYEYIQNTAKVIIENNYASFLFYFK